ncbi:MAG: hypothetical protein WC708_00560 [Lentisphaeria bacterium]
MKKKSCLSKRLQRQYQQVLLGQAESWFYPHPHAFGWGRHNSSTAEWQAYLFAKEWGNRIGVDLMRLQRIVIQSNDGECVYRYARDIDEANIRKLQRAVVRSGNPDAIRRFSLLPKADKTWLERYLLIAEVLGR